MTIPAANKFDHRKPLRGVRNNGHKYLKLLKISGCQYSAVTSQTRSETGMSYSNGSSHIILYLTHAVSQLYNFRSLSYTRGVMHEVSSPQHAIMLHSPETP